MGKQIDPAKQEQYDQVVSFLQESYVGEYFKLDDYDFEIISTIRYDPLLTDIDNFTIILNDYDNHLDNSSLFFLFDEHYHRFLFSMKFFKFGFKLARQQLLEKLNESLKDLNKSNSYRLKVSINKKGNVNIIVTETPQRFNLMDGFNSLSNYHSPFWSVYIDKEPVHISPFTSLKTSKRDEYNKARHRVLPEPDTYGIPQEVLLYNTANQITEGSITNIAIKGQDPKTGDIVWFTPVLASGCLCGVVRHMLLSKGLLKEKQISLKELRKDEELLLFNGLMGVVKGRIVN
ncbi:hypothetical protein WICMUC_004808 [Wickerhamomyces mucosus]|uniref:Aminodeoxychorismate lyase n=1 Tax=Wickerhamomyces mucosus TaxID=1378264 RepID=A0A9P8PG56_9ASCO|nr:hypothetical protein WICMUC_004808 [Wickerhamomyces mucosus]